MTSYFSPPTGTPASNGAVSPLSPPGNQAPRSTALTNRLTSVLASSYTDTDIREALGILDDRGTQNTPETRRNLRLDIQKEVIDSNGQIIQDFGKVADVRIRSLPSIMSLQNEANWNCPRCSNYRELEKLSLALTRYARICGNV
jgi:hypothetical protein